MDDEFLVQTTLNGNKQAFRFLVLRYQKPIFKMLGSLVYDEQMVEEMAQETFLRAYQSLAGFDPVRASFSTWLFTNARNLALNELEKRKVRLKNASLLLENDKSGEPSPEQELQSLQTMTSVRAAIRRLPQDFRLAVVLSCLDGHSISEIAEIAGCSEGTVKSRIFRGKELLRGFLQPVLGGNHGK